MASERGRGAGVVVALAVLVALAAAVLMTELFVAPGYRLTAIRLIAALILLAALSHVRAIVLASVERRTAWGADDTGDGWADRRATDLRLARFRDEITFSVRSQSYFEHLLWPRLVGLARARGAASETLEKPPGRRFGRGPSVAALARLIASLESGR